MVDAVAGAAAGASVDDGPGPAGVAGRLAVGASGDTAVDDDDPTGEEVGAVEPDGTTVASARAGVDEGDVSTTGDDVNVSAPGAAGVVVDGGVAAGGVVDGAVVDGVTATNAEGAPVLLAASATTDGVTRPCGRSPSAGLVVARPATAIEHAAAASAHGLSRRQGHGRRSAPGASEMRRPSSTRRLGCHGISPSGPAVPPPTVIAVPPDRPSESEMHTDRLTIELKNMGHSTNADSGPQWKPNESTPPCPAQ